MKTLILFVLYLLVPPNLLASEITDECSVDDTRAPLFTASLMAIKNVLARLCEPNARQVIALSEIELVSHDAIKILNLEAAKLLPNVVDNIAALPYKIIATHQKKIGGNHTSYKKLGYLLVNGNHIVKLGTKVEHAIGDSQLRLCGADEPTDCLRYLKSYLYLANRIHEPIRAGHRLPVVAHLKTLTKRWESYLTEARSQSFLDIAVTTILYEVTENENGILNPPPQTQLFFLHVNPVIEYIESAVDGQQFEEALAIEIVGANWWDKTDSCFGVPCGVSLVATYSNRIGLDNVNYGLMFTLDNQYQFGVTRYKNSIGHSETGFYISVDFLKLFKEKNEMYESWRSKVGK